MLPVAVERQGTSGEVIPLADTTGNKAAASGTATLAHDSNYTVFVTGFEITGSGATAASVVQATLGPVIGNKTLSYEIAVPAGATVGVAPLIVQFPVPIPAKDLATDIVLTVPSFGTGSTNACGNIHGFKMPLVS